MFDYSIVPRTRGPQGPLPEPRIEIVTGANDASLTEATDFALGILRTVQDYGTIKVEAKA